MKVLIIGMGQVGGALADTLKARGDYVRGTTTTAEKVGELAARCDDVRVLTGDDEAAVADAAEGMDFVVLTVSPKLEKTTTPEDRETEYRRTLVATARNAAAHHQNCLFLSSFSVYGDGGKGAEPITEETPVSQSDEPSTKYYIAAENELLATAGGCVLRAQDIYGGPKDFSFLDRLKLGHKLMGGKVAFGGDGLLYRLHYRDGVDALVHAMDKRLSGVFNLCWNGERPPTVQGVFDRIADDNDLPRLEFLGLINNPTKPIAGNKLEATGFTCNHTTYDFS